MGRGWSAAPQGGSQHHAAWGRLSNCWHTCWRNWSQACRAKRIRWTTEHSTHTPADLACTTPFIQSGQLCSSAAQQLPATAHLSKPLLPPGLGGPFQNQEAPSVMLSFTTDSPRTSRSPGLCTAGRALPGADGSCTVTCRCLPPGAAGEPAAASAAPAAAAAPAFSTACCLRCTEAAARLKARSASLSGRNGGRVAAPPVTVRCRGSRASVAGCGVGSSANATATRCW